MHESDLKITAMLFRAAERVGLEWRPPPCPESSMLDDWFLCVACAGSQRPAPVPFFTEVHGELTRSWMVVFYCQKPTSSLTTLDGGAGRGCTGVPPLERSIAMLLCPNTASTQQGKPCLPSWACRYLSGLSGDAYAACGEAASALHATALLQILQVIALRDLQRRAGWRIFCFQKSRQKSSFLCLWVTRGHGESRTDQYWTTLILFSRQQAAAGS